MFTVNQNCTSESIEEALGKWWIEKDGEAIASIQTHHVLGTLNKLLVALCQHSLLPD